LNDGGIAFRGSFIIDNHQVVKHISINDLPVGRNVDEYLRLVKVNILFIYRLSNTLLNTDKFAQPHGPQEPGLCLQDQKTNSMLIGKKFMVKNDLALFIS
jgi:hypothetical protein